MIQRFLEYQRINKGLSEQTIEGYRKEIGHFAHYGKNLGLRWSTITAKDMEDYVKSEAERGMKPRTIKRRVEVIRLVYTWAIHEGLLTYNPAQYTQSPKIREELPKAADAERLEEYMKTEAQTRESLIVHILVALIYETGLRIGECLELRGEDFDLERNRIRVKGKGGKERYAYYSNRTMDYARMMSKRQGRIFTDDAMTYRYMMYRELPGIHPHAIRHAFAVSQLDKGMDLKTLSVLMGHKHVQTTEIYAQLSEKHTAATYKKFN